MKRTFVLTNHATTADQVDDLQNNWDVDEVVELPPELKKIWATIPPDVESIAYYVQPVMDWLESNSADDDLVWVQGEWGATVTTLLWCAAKGLTAIYSTTGRVATETRADSGTLMTHVFKHVRFRKYPL